METVAREGEILAGKYRVDRVLGVGGMGVVVAAHHLELDAKVAIKFLLPETLSNAEAVARFAREARAAVKIKSEHVARVSDVGKLDSGAPYMVMEFLEGLDLSAWLSQRGALSVEQAVEFILQASEAIAEAHSLGIVHRDLKPANLFVVKRPDGGSSVKVLDFGISKTASLTGSGGEGSMTRTTTMLGSPLYMSPEHIQSSRNVDPRTDTWALGVILYELVTGHTPFDGEHIAELMFNIISSTPKPIRGYRSNVPEALEQVILRCLEKQRDARYGTIAELAVALSPFAPARSAVSVERITGVATVARAPSSPATVLIGPPSASSSPVVDAKPAAGGTQAAWGQTRAERKTRTSTWLAVGGGGVGALLLAGVMLAKVMSSAGAVSAAASSPSPMATLAPSAKPPEVIVPEPPAPVSRATTPPASVSAAADSSAPVASARIKPPPHVKPNKPNPPATAAPPRDPWGGSQH